MRTENVVFEMTRFSSYH